VRKGREGEAQEKKKESCSRVVSPKKKKGWKKRGGAFHTIVYGIREILLFVTFNRFRD
jgi:hypothetical protein